MRYAPLPQVGCVDDDVAAADPAGFHAAAAAVLASADTRGARTGVSELDGDDPDGRLDYKELLEQLKKRR